MLREHFGGQKYDESVKACLCTPQVFLWYVYLTWVILTCDRCLKVKTFFWVISYALIGRFKNKIKIWF